MTRPKSRCAAPVAAALTLFWLTACGGGAKTAPSSVAAPASTSSVAATSTSARATSSTVASPPSTTRPTTIAPTTSTTTEPPPPPSFDAARFDEFVRSATVGRGDQAVSAAVVRNGEVIHVFADGVRVPGTDDRVTAQTRFRIASISKVLTAVTVMRLVEEGALRLDDTPLADLAVELDVAASDMRIGVVTVADLLSHTSGWSADKSRYFGAREDLSCRSNAVAVLSGPLARQPGSGFEYSNTNYCLLGLVVEMVMSRDVHEAVQHELLDGLGLVNMARGTTYGGGADDVVYVAQPGRSFMEALGAAGDWMASASDIAIVLAALQPDHGPLISPLSDTTLRRMRRPVPAVKPGPDWTYGLGLLLWDDDVWGHTGTVEQTRAVALNLPDGTTVVVLVAGLTPDSSEQLKAVAQYAVALASD